MFKKKFNLSVIFEEYKLYVYVKEAVVGRKIISGYITHLLTIMHIFEVCDVLSIDSNFSRAVTSKCHFTSCIFPHAV